jgi:predicted TPR repeat methyltransferase
LGVAPGALPPSDPVAAAFARLKREEAEAAAIAAAERAAAAAPGDPGAWLKLGTLLSKAGRQPAALDAFRRCLALTPERAEVRHLIAALGGEAAPTRASDAYVANVFDAMAERFDETLVTFLDYRAPEILAALMARRLGERRNLEIVDLGCGTGLMARHLRSRARRLVGIDLSAEMLKRAAGRGYDALHQAEIGTWLATQPGSFDLAVAADVLCYFGELDSVLASVRRALKPSGQLLFTVERRNGDGWSLGASGRYLHSESYIRSAAQSAGFTLTDLDPDTLRTEHGTAVEGYAVALSNGGA